MRKNNLNWLDKKILETTRKFEKIAQLYPEKLLKESREKEREIQLEIIQSIFPLINQLEKNITRFQEITELKTIKEIQLFELGLERLLFGIRNNIKILKGLEIQLKKAQEIFSEQILQIRNQITNKNYQYLKTDGLSKILELKNEIVNKKTDGTVRNEEIKIFESNEFQNLIKEIENYNELNIKNLNSLRILTFLLQDLSSRE